MSGPRYRNAPSPMALTRNAGSAGWGRVNVDEWVGGERSRTGCGEACFMDGDERAEPEGGTLVGVKPVNEPM